MRHKYLIGIDEVGRGPIAGPVAVGAFVVRARDSLKVRRIFHGVKESKQLTTEKREKWFEVIQSVRREGLVDFRVTFKSERVIDRKGLSHAIREALKSSIGALRLKGSKVSPRYSKVLLDGGLKAPNEFENQLTIIKGDEKEMTIALASICAKVLRDRKMCSFAKKYPQYGFEVHKGYGTKTHYEAIEKKGMCEIHRRSFLKTKN